MEVYVFMSEGIIEAYSKDRQVVIDYIVETIYDANQYHIYRNLSNERKRRLAKDSIIVLSPTDELSHDYEIV